MISPSEIKTKAERKYLTYLQCVVQDIPFSKMVIQGDKNPSKTLSELQSEILSLVNQSKEKKGYGFTIEYKTIKTKTIGTQSLPESIYFETERDFLKYLGKEKEVQTLVKVSKEIINAFQELQAWVIRNPLKIIQYEKHWDDLLKICTYFKNNPKPNLYIRELPVKVHTKFIESNKGILLELLNAILPPEHITSEFATAKDFEKRFGLKISESQIRIRILDKNLSDRYLSGLSDISVTENEFINLKLPCKRVFILENKTNYSNLMNFLTLPQMESTIGIFGSGFSVSNLKKALWLSEKEIFYWGDIDSHGFQILSQIRGYFPHTKSILMDFETLNTFKDDWSIGKPISINSLANLTEDENQLFSFVKADNVNTIRLEQEKISQDFVLKKIEAI